MLLQGNMPSRASSQMQLAGSYRKEATRHETSEHCGKIVNTRSLASVHRIHIRVP